MTVEIGRVVPGGAITGVPTSSGPGAPGTSILQQNIMNVLGDTPIAIPTAQNAGGTAGIGQSVAWLTLNETQALSAATFPLVAAQGGGTLIVPERAIMWIRRGDTTNVSATNRSYSILYTGVASNPMNGTFAISWNAAPGGAPSNETIIKEAAGFDTGNAFPGTVFENLGLGLVPTAGALAAAGGTCIIRVMLIYYVLPLPVSTI